jgi:thiamine biosynthesis lipoprotein
LKLKKLVTYFLPVILIITLFFFWYSKRRVVSFSDVRLMLGTIVEINVYGEDGADLKDGVEAAFKRISEIEIIADRYTGKSEISKINRTAASSPVAVSEELFEMLTISREVSDLTSGAFDVTTASLVDLWAFDTDGRLPGKDEIERALLDVGFRKVVLDEKNSTVSLDGPGIKVDLGGMAKGYAVSEALDVLEEFGIESGVINAGGDMAILGSKTGKPWKIGVQDPRDPENLCAVLSLEDTSVVTSGDYERFFEIGGTRYHHILDPHTGYPARKSISVTVIFGDAAWADALATAIFVLGPKEGLDLANSLPSCEALIVGPNEDIYMTDGISDIVELIGK